MNRGGLFIGVESFNWGLPDFDRAVAFALSLNFSYLVLKVYEITQGDWYQTSELKGSTNVATHIKAQGIDVLPYGYFYGNAPTSEILAIKNYLAYYGDFVLDMEGEFDNNPTRMQPYADGLAGHVGNLYISTWGNPLDHQWGANIKLMSPLVRAWQPQVYTPYLASVWQGQWAIAGVLPNFLEPTFNIWPDGTSPSSWQSPSGEFSVWEYQGLTQASQMTQQAVKALMPSTSLPVSPALAKQFDDVWYSKAGLVPAGYQSGIYQAVKRGFFELKYTACFPTSEEIATVDWNGNTLLYQTLSNGYHAEYTADGMTNVYAPTDALVWSYKP